MKEFGEWFSNPARRVAPAPAPAPEANPEQHPLQELADTLQAQAEEIGLEVRIRLHAKCWSCERKFEFLGDIGDYDPNTRESNVCGGSDRCIP